MFDTIENFPLLVGFLASAIHVFSGPDHLAAVAPIAVNRENVSWQVGLCWGLGHTIGLLLIGMLFFFFGELIPIEFISSQSEKLVGIILIIIGAYVFFKLIRKKNANKEHSHIHLHVKPGNKPFAHFHPHKHNMSKTHNHKHFKKKGALTAIGIGIIHGFAGISHLISILPTLAFSKHGAVYYLGGFTLGTILSMIIFSVLLGLIGKSATNKNKQLHFYIVNSVAATFAIFIGIFWIYQSS